MRVTWLALSRPVAVLMVFLAVLMLGAVAYTRLGAQLFPDVNNPVVSIIVDYPGAAPDDVERLVSRPIEDAVSGLSHVDVVSSSSSEGRATVTVRFTDRANADLAAVDVERRVSGVRASLPADVRPPVVLKVDLNQQALLAIALAGGRPLDQLQALADDQLKPRLEAVDGVGSVTVAGGLEREIQVKADPARLRAYGLSLDQVQEVLARENVSLPGGSIDRDRQQLNIRLEGLVQSPRQLGALVVHQGPAGLVRLRDVASVEDGFRRVTSRSRLDGALAVTLSVVKQATANEVRTADAVRAELERLRAELPADVTLVVVGDGSRFTRNALDSVNRTLLEAIVLTGLVLLLFLHTLRSTAIVLVAIPTSLIATFLAMWVLGFSLNIMSTLALVLVIGVLVDDSIVVLENIVRHLELGETPWSAALKGRGEIGMAAIAITLVDVVIFLPVAFLSGSTGGFFRQFALVIVVSVLISLVVSFTLTPMLASRWLRADNVRVRGRGPWARFVRGWEGGFEWLTTGYRRLLGVALRWRAVPPLLALLSLAGALALIPLGLVKFEFLPRTDNGNFLVRVELPPGASLAATDDVLRQVERRMAAIPEVEHTLATAGVSNQVGVQAAGGQAAYGRVSVRLYEREARRRAGQRDIFAVMEEAGRALADIPGATLRVQDTSGLNAEQPVQVRITGSDLAVVNRLAARVEELVRVTPGAVGVTNSGVAGSPEQRLVVDRDRLADLGLNAQQVGRTLRTAVEGAVVGKLRPADADEVDIRLIAADAARADVAAVAELPLTVLRDGRPSQVTLGQVTRLEPVAGATSLDRRNRQRVVTIGANLTGTTPLNDVTTPIAAGIARLTAEGAAPAGYAIQLGGQASDQREAFSQLLLALVMSVALMYMLLAALYESVIHPFASMLALPVAVVGAFAGLAATGTTMNVLVMIGLIVLTGLVGKNGILLIDYTNTLRRQGRSRDEALLAAGPTRLRPILMTSLTLMVGLLPLAAKIHEGSELWAGIGVALIGGMASSTLLSLFVVPTVYTLIDDFQIGLLRLWGARPGALRRPAAPSGDGGAPSSEPSPTGSLQSAD